MWCRKSIRLAMAAGFGLRLLAGPAGRVIRSCRTLRVCIGLIASGAVWTQAIYSASTDGQAEVSRPAPTALNAKVQDGEMIGHEQYGRVYMNAGGRRLMLLVPQGFGADITSPEKVVLANRDYSCVLSFRIAAPGSIAVASLNADLCRAWLTTRLGDLKILEEFSLTAANGSGPAFDLKCKVDGVVRASRVTFIASPAGVLEFNSLSAPETFEKAKAKLWFLLRGFQISDANGKLEIVPAQSQS